jgi:polyhydroxyalkanoate synthesis regulator phasin
MAGNNGASPFTDNQLTRLVKQSATQAWQTGVGIYARAGTRSWFVVGGMLGLGERVDRGARHRVVAARTGASDAWDRLEAAIVHRVARALNSLQIPTARDVHELNRRVEALQSAVVALERRAATPAAPPVLARAKPGARGKPAARKKSSARKKAGA